MVCVIANCPMLYLQTTKWRIKPVQKKKQYLMKRIINCDLVHEHSPTMYHMICLDLLPLFKNIEKLYISILGVRLGTHIIKCCGRDYKKGETLCKSSC